MKSEKGITVIALLLVIIIIFGCIFAYKVMSDKKNTENTNVSSTPNTSTSNNSSTNNSSNGTSNIGLGKEFKQAMDSYEAFMDEYIAFMMKCNKAIPTNVATVIKLINEEAMCEKYIRMKLRKEI